jgi:hypothetical protein
MQTLPESSLAYVLGAEPWTAWTARSVIPGCGGSRKEDEELRKASVASPLVQALVTELKQWPGKVLSSHKSAEQSFHKLALAVSLGLRRDDPGADEIASLVMSNVSTEGPFGLPMKIGEAYGGSGEKVGAWALCDAPVVLRSLVRMGYSEDSAVRRGIDYLRSLARDTDFPCAVSGALGSWRGPGRKIDPCPYATLVMLELLLEKPKLRDSNEARRAAECLLGLWERSREEHPYIFYMGNDFRKLKAPLIWYDIVHVADALSRPEWLRKDPRLGGMLDILEAKADPDLRFKPESAYMTWKGQDFGQKKVPSPYLTALVLGILVRAGRYKLPAGLHER